MVGDEFIEMWQEYYDKKSEGYSTMPNARATAFLINALMVMPSFWAAMAAPL